MLVEKPQKCWPFSSDGAQYCSQRISLLGSFSGIVSFLASVSAGDVIVGIKLCLFVSVVPRHTIWSWRGRRSRWPGEKENVGPVNRVHKGCSDVTSCCRFNDAASSAVSHRAPSQSGLSSHYLRRGPTKTSANSEECARRDV